MDVQSVDMLRKVFKTFRNVFDALFSFTKIYETFSRFVFKPLSLISRDRGAVPRNSINGLPSELLVDIFSIYIKSEGYRKFLRSIPLVCKRWNHIYSTPLLWRDVNSAGQGWTLDEMKKLGKNGLLASVRLLEITDGHPYSEDDITQLIRYCHNLKELKVEKISLAMVPMDVLTEECPNIESLNLRVYEDGIPIVLGPFLNVRGHNIKKLVLDNHFFICDNHLVSTIAINCHSLEELLFHERVIGLPRFQIPLDELMLGCPKLRRLAIKHCDVIPSEIDDRQGFKDMVSLTASEIDFAGMSLYSMLRDSRNLQVLNLNYCLNVPLTDISEIPSDKVEDLEITGLENTPAKPIAEAVGKWKRTLKMIRLDHSDTDLSGVLEAYLRDNPNPKLEKLFLLLSHVAMPVLKKVMRASINLHHVGCMSYESADIVTVFNTRKQVENFCAS